MRDPLSWLVAALAALLATLSITELVRVAALRLRAVDVPGGRRVHRRPTARLGGLGIGWGFALALALATGAHPLWRSALLGADRGLVGLLLGATLMLVVGLLDDVRSLAALHKLALQIAAALLLYALGWRVDTLGLPGVGTCAVGAWSLPLTVGWIVLVTNAFNLIDGLDGLACGLALVALLAMGALLAPQGGALMLVTAALAGALLGFLWFNLHPALIFMGDAGSLFVGFLLAGLSLRVGHAASAGAFPLVPALLLAVPLFDTLEAVRRRVTHAARASTCVWQFVGEARRRVLAPDGQHVHHRLLRAGVPTRRAASLLWGAAAAFAAAGVAMAVTPLLGVPVVGVACTVSLRGLGRAGEGAPAEPEPSLVPPLEPRGAAAATAFADALEASEETRRAA